jgi:ribosomal protein L21E
MATAKTSRSGHFIFKTRKGEMMMHVKRHSDDFACGRWVHVDDGLNHKYAGFDGEILEIKGKSITVQIYDVGLDEENSICLVPLRFTFPGVRM